MTWVLVELDLWMAKWRIENLIRAGTWIMGAAFRPGMFASHLLVRSGTGKRNTSPKYNPE